MFRNKELKQEKQLNKENELMNKYGLEDLSAKDYESVKKIISDLAGKNLIKSGLALSFAKAEEQVKVGYLAALVEQNFIIIRQLNELNKNLSQD